MSHAYDDEWREEARRHQMLEAGYDQASHRCLVATGVGPGWSCLEVGAGTGSIATWLCDRVGEEGSVVATDLQTAFLEQIDRPNLEIRCHDIVHDEIEQAHYDLVHARQVLEYLTERDDGLRHMAGALKPGGWLVVESVDFCSCVPLAGEGTELFARSIRVGLEFVAGLGFDPYYGRRIGEAMRQLGLQDVQVEGKCHEIGGQRPLTDAWPLALHRFRETFVREGWFTEEEIDALPRLMRQADFCAIAPTLFSVRGRCV